MSDDEDIEMLRRAFDVGQASGIGGEWNLEEILEEIGILSKFTRDALEIKPVRIL